MSFDGDIFISYAQLDDEPLSAGDEGWITRFHSTLAAMLSMELGDAAKIWRDEKKLAGNDVLSEEIMEQLSRTALMLSVLSPRYLKSDWCTRELAEFCSVAEQTTGLIVDRQSRLVKIFKSPIKSLEMLPEPVQDTLGHEFFTYEDNVPLELDSVYGEQYKHAYYKKLKKLSVELAGFLETLATSGDAAQQRDAAASQTGVTVYLAECSHDRWDEREVLEFELRQHGYRVLPDRKMPRDNEFDYCAAVKDMLGQSALSVHLVGELYGAVPDGPGQQSIVALQNGIAVEQCRNESLKRIIWLPAGTRSTQSHQQEFIDSLLQDASVQYGADLIVSDFESLKHGVHSTLEKLSESEATQPGADTTVANRQRQIYLICTERDRKSTVPLRKHCRDLGYDVVLPAFEGDACAVRESHQKFMSSCDAVLVYYGEGDEAWKRNLDFDFMKIAGYRDEAHPLLANFTYLAAPRSADKEDMLDMEEPDLIDGLGGFDPDSMADFLQALGS